MKRLITLLVTFLLSVSVFAQNTAPISFLGIPVDGTKANMVKAIENKGFEHIKTNNGEDVLIGEFNGRKSHVWVGTNRNKVYRIMVAYANYTNEAQIKIDYNNLLYQFKKSANYVELEENLPIPDDEDISYEMLVHNKRYDAAFWGKPHFTEEEVLQINKDIAKMSRKEAIKYATQKAFNSGSMNGLVWFAIDRDGYEEYEICIYYDNLLNKANGEDL